MAWPVGGTLAQVLGFGRHRLAVDEKPTIQVTLRPSGYVKSSSGKVVRGTETTYKRHGRVNLFAALEVATGIVRGKRPRPKRGKTSRTLWKRSCGLSA
jgi:hypothetical protein